MIKHYIGYCCSFVIFLLFINTAFAKDKILATDSKLPIKYNLSNIVINNADQLNIVGYNKSRNPVVLVLRIDNEKSNNYYSRFNKEITILPGEFSINIPLAGIKTSRKQILTQPFTQLIVFEGKGTKHITATELSIKTADVRAENILAFDFGEVDGALFPQFDKITTTSDYLYGQMRTIVRTSGDALIHDGIDGIDLIKLPWLNGKWKLSVWLADQGEWEYLAHFLRRKIIANGTTIVDDVFDWQEWVNKIYFAGINKEAIIDGDLWECVGKRRNGRITKIIDITDNELVVKFSGTNEAKFIAALVLEPVESDFADQTEAKCRQQFLSNWPVQAADEQLYTEQQEVIIADVSSKIKHDDSYIVAKDTILNLCFQIKSHINDNHPFIHILAPQKEDDQQLQVVTRYGHWRYERPSPNASILHANDSYLSTNLEQLRLSNLMPRNIYLQVKIPKGAVPGDYQGSIQIASNSQFYSYEFNIKVLDIELPRLSQSVGLYLDIPPYYQWFNMKKQQEIAFKNDLELLYEYGFSTAAPPLETPNNKVNIAKFKEMIELYTNNSFNDKIVAYTPMKRLLTTTHQAQAEICLQQLQASLGNKLFDKIYWSVFDEPKQIKDITLNINWLKNLPFDMKLVGHANNNKQKFLFDKVDLLLVNHGVKLTSNKINQLKKNSEIWLYNMDNNRIAAGFYLWKTKIPGYLQWHAQMPTADPFDPTDGREGDSMYLYPIELSTTNDRSIHKKLLNLHEAVLDLRWITWLQNIATTEQQADKLLKKLQTEIPDDWNKAKKISTDKLVIMRQKIINLADTINPNTQ